VKYCTTIIRTVTYTLQVNVWAADGARNKHAETNDELHDRCDLGLLPTLTS